MEGEEERDWDPDGTNILEEEWNPEALKLLKEEPHFANCKAERISCSLHLFCGPNDVAKRGLGGGGRDSDQSGVL